MCYFMVHAPTLDFVFEEMKLFRFVKKNYSEKSKTRFTKELLDYCLNNLGEKLYQNVVVIRTKIDIENKQTFEEGRCKNYNNIIGNLNKVLYIVDGRNQACSKKYIKGQKSMTINTIIIKRMEVELNH